MANAEMVRIHTHNIQEETKMKNETMNARNQLPGGGFHGGEQQTSLPGGGFHGGEQQTSLPGAASTKETRTGRVTRQRAGRR